MALVSSKARHRNCCITPQRLEGQSRSSFPVRAIWFTIFMRFVRLVIVVPLLEEIFLARFLMRYLIDGQRFDSIPFGTFRPGTIHHGRVSLPTRCTSPPTTQCAFLTGCIYNGLACKTKKPVRLRV